MDDSIKACLFDILNSINEIDSYFTDTPERLRFIRTILKQNEL
jgi:hypothetical protein